jgi:hypothetical protein
MTIIRGLVIGTAAEEPPEEPAEPWDGVQGILYDGSNGVNGYFWNRHLKFQWKNQAGDWLDANQTEQGTTAFGSVAVTATGTEKTVTITGLAALVQRWVDGTNRGMLLRTASGGGQINIYSRHDPATEKRPTMTVTASGSGTTTLTCTADMTCRIDEDGDSNNVRVFADVNALRAVLQFDVSEVVGTVTAAQLNLVSSNQFAPNSTLQVMEIDCPTIWVGDTSGQTVETGLANNTYWDAEINAQSGVYYARPHNHGYLNDFFKWQNDISALPESILVVKAQGAGCLRSDQDSGSFGSNPNIAFATDLREWAVRGKFITTDWGSADYKWFFDSTVVDLGPPPNPANEPEEAYCRYYLKLDDDFQATSTDPQVLKAAMGFMCIVPGVTDGFGGGGVRGDGTNGFRTHPHINSISTDSENPYADLHAVGSYQYYTDQEDIYGDSFDTGVNNVPPFWGNTTRWGCGTPSGSRGGDGFPGFCMERDRWYCVEQRVRMNTVGSPTGAADGVLEIWINGVKVFSKSTYRWRHISTIKVQSIWCNWYHGGTGPDALPSQEEHYEMSSLVVASSYIGPMRMEDEPSWVATTAGELKTVSANNTFFSTNPNVYPDATYGSHGDSGYLTIEDFSGGVYNPHLGPRGSMIFHGGGDAAWWGNAVVKLDLDTRLYSLAHSTSVLPSRNSGSPDNVMTLPGINPDPLYDQVHGEYGDGRPGSAHTYDSLEILPPWDNGGTKGALLRPASYAVHPFNSQNTGWSHRFPFATEDWARWSTNGYPASDGTMGAGGACAYDPKRKRVWWFAIGMVGGGFIRYLNLATQAQVQVTTSGSGAAPTGPDSLIMRWDAQRDILLFVYPTSTNVVIRYLTGLSNATPSWGTATLSQDMPSREEWQHPLDYVPDVDRWFLVSPHASYQDGVWEIQIPTTITDSWTVTRRAFSGVTTFPVKYVSGKRWSYSPKLQNFVWHGDLLSSGVPHVYRPHGVE